MRKLLLTIFVVTGVHHANATDHNTWGPQYYCSTSKSHPNGVPSCDDTMTAYTNCRREPTHVDPDNMACRDRDHDADKSPADNSPAAIRKTLKETSTSVPPEIKRQEEEEAALQKAANASPSLARYMEEMDAATENMQMALTASICHLRSDIWLRSFTDIYQTYTAEETNRFGISYQQAGEVQGSALKKAKRKPINCQTLLNGQIMDNLDQIQQQGIGGYH